MSARPDAPATPPGPGARRASDGWRAAAVLVLAVTQVLSAPLTPVLLGEDASTGRVSDANDSILTPAGYAFAIWGLVYLASLGYAVRQALPSQQRRQVHRQTGWWAAGAFLASTAWVPLFGAGQLAVAQLVLVGLVICLGTAVARYAEALHDGDAAPGDGPLLATPLTLYLGWASVATVAGAATTGVSLGLQPATVLQVVLAVMALLLVGLVAVAVISTAPAVLAFTAAAVWGLVAIGVETADASVAVTAYVVAGAAVAALVVRAVRSPDRRRALLG